MITSFAPRASLRSVLLSTSLVLAGTAGCGKGADGGACPAPPTADGGAAPYQSFAQGSATGTGVSASFCNTSVAMSGPAGGTQSGRLIFAIDSTAPFASTALALPAGALAGVLTGSIQVKAPTAGVYRSSDAQICGTLSFSYGTLAVPGASCRSDASSSACPKGCTSTYVCGNASAVPCCVPLANTFVYEATAASSCTGGTQPSLGSWTLTLTEVAPYREAANPYGQVSYVVHGTLSAVLKGTTDTTGTTNLSLGF